MAITEKAKAQIYLDGKQAEAAIEGLKKKSKELRDDLSKAVKAGDATSITKLKKELNGVNAATRSLKKDTFDYQQVLRNINGSSYLKLNKALKTVKSTLKGMARTDAGYKQKTAEVKLLRAQMDKLNADQRANTSGWSKMATGFNKYFGMATAGVAALAGIGYGVTNLIKGLTGLDDNLANVMKTTGLTREEVRGLYTDFKQLNTRTKNSVLLGYAEEAGRLGIQGKADILGFVEQANKIGTALGDDLGDTKAAVNTIGKLVGMYKVGAQYGVGFEEGMNKVGSAINEIAANSAAAAPYQVEYLKRLSGTAKQAKITADQVLGYSSVLDQNGQAVEMAATAQGKLMIDMFTSPGEYAEIAGMKLGEFTNLLQTDANEAFLRFLEGINGNNEGFSVMATKMDEMGISGARAVQVISTLASNTDNIRKEQTLANKAMTEGVSLTNEYNIKNDNLAGSWEKLTKAMRAKVMNPTLISWMEGFVSAAAKIVETPLSKTLQDEQEEVNTLSIKLQSANLKENERASILERLNTLAPKVATALSDEKVSLEDLTAALADYNKEMSMKILIAEGDEDIAKQKTKVETYKKLSIEAEADMAKQLRKSLDWFEKKAPDVKEKAEAILYDTQLSLVQKAEELNRLALDNTTLGNTALFTSLDSYRSFYNRYTDELHSMDLLVTKTKGVKDDWSAIYGNTSENDASSGNSDSSGNDNPSTTTPLGKVIAPSKKMTIKDPDLDVDFQREMEAIEDSEAEAYAKSVKDLIKQTRSVNQKILDIEKTAINQKAMLLAQYGKGEEYEARAKVIDQWAKSEIATVKDVADVNKDLRQAFEQYSVLEMRKTIKSAEQELDNMTLSADATQEEIDKLKKEIIAMNEVLAAVPNKNLSEIADITKQVSGELSGLNGELGQTFAKLGDMASLAQQAIESGDTQTGAMTAGLGGAVDLYNMVTTQLEENAALEADWNAVIEKGVQLRRMARIEAAGVYDESLFGTDNPYEAAIAGAQQYSAAMQELQGMGADLGDGEVQTGTKKVKSKKNHWGGFMAGGLVGSVIADTFAKESVAVMSSLSDQYGELFDSETFELNADLLADYDKLDDATKTLVDNWDEVKAKAVEAQEQMSATFTALAGDIGTTLSDSLVSAFKDGDLYDGMDDFHEHMSDILEDIMVQIAFNAAFGKMFDNLEDSMNESFGENGDGSITDDLMAFEDTLAAGMPGFNDALVSIQDTLGNAGYTNALTNDDDATAQSATSGGFETMSQDTGSELNGRFTALQASNEVIKLETIKMGAAMVATQGMVLIIVGYLEEIRDNTNTLPFILEKLDKIEKNTAEL